MIDNYFQFFGSPNESSFISVEEFSSYYRSTAVLGNAMLCEFLCNLTFRR
jgi:hypothetical protein